MSSSGRQHRKAGPRSSTGPVRRTMGDGGVYIGFIIFGIVIAGFFFLVIPEQWKALLLGYLIAVAFLINLYAFRAWRGHRLAGWQQSLARVPLRFVGYRQGGKPIQAAHDRPGVRAALFISIAVSVVILLGLTYLLVPGVAA